MPPIRIALALQPINVVTDASGLFNVVRNIGGAIGIAMMDTVMFSRAPEHADRISDLVKSDPAAAAAILGLTLDELPTPDDAMSMLGIMDLISSAGLTMAINECWWLLGLVAFATLPVLWLLGPVESAKAIKKKAPITDPASAG